MNGSCTRTNRAGCRLRRPLLTETARSLAGVDPVSHGRAMAYAGAVGYRDTARLRRRIVWSGLPPRYEAAESTTNP